MEKNYQILLKGIYTNKLVLIETENVDEFKRTIEDLKKGRYSNLVILQTNIY